MDVTPPEQRRRIGRPPTPPEERLTGRVYGRVTPGDRLRVEALLAQRGITETEFVRSLVLRELDALGV